VSAPDPPVDPVVANALARARSLIAASAHAGRGDAPTRRRLRRLLADPAAVAVVIALTDEVMRFPEPRRAAAALRRAVARVTPGGFGAYDRSLLRLAATASLLAPGPVVALVARRVRALTATLILDDVPRAIAESFADHRRRGLRLNVNVLGEAVLGEREAAQRLARVLAMIGRDDVDYVSVKLSSVVAPLVTLDHGGSLERVCERLHDLYRAAGAHGTFVNLDMEEFRDLRLTLDAFMSVLSEDEFLSHPAGVVLQAYLPESHGALDELLEWSAARRAIGGAPIKVRLVKGANLAMESVEAELHGWVAAPYATKADVDASYLGLLDRALRPEHRDHLRVGVASHNLFHLSWALELAASRGVGDQLDVEMLEGMADAEADALVASGQPVLLYAPVTRRDDFPAAVAYLVRRLDENTAPENYLRAALSIADDPRVFDEQRLRFLDALEGRAAVSPRRVRRPRPRRLDGFANEPDGDPTDPAFVAAVDAAVAAVRGAGDPVIDTLDHLGPPGEPDYEVGHDPNDEGRPWYRYRVAGVAEVDRALEFASSGFAHWHSTPLAQRRAVLERAADVMSERRATTIALMARDGGKTVAEADPEVSEGIDFARHYARHALDDDRSDPLGVVLVVPPWNFPYAIPAGGVLAALAAGSAVVIKPAPEAVAVAEALVGQLWDAGVPRDVLQMVPTRDDEVGEHLVTHVGVSAVVLTGSYDTARMFSSWKPTLTLLGETSGKNAMVITASADIDLAVRDLVQAAFGHAGQKCSAASLAIVERALADDPRFYAQLADAVTSLAVGSALDPATQVGPIIRPPDAALERALTSLDDGESWLVEPARADVAGHLWRPGVKLGVRPGSWSHRHEWFGPVLGVMVANDLDQAIAWQNDTPFGLTAGLHSLDADEVERWASKVRAGNLYVNRTTTGAVVARQPFGGWKRSRVGPTAKAGGDHYVEVLRRWRPVTDPDATLAEAARWWRERGSTPRDDAGLASELNVVRYVRPLSSTVVRVGATTSPTDVRLVREMAALAGVDVEFSAAEAVRGVLDVTLESPAELVARTSEGQRVRWLSPETPPAHELVERAVALDPRPLAASGAVEMARWLDEQSVTVTVHRYGNLRAGPRPSF
jgi:RHH-type transcriptional regulator, proline utilization regulon repressor / proline dehydrogenase / delta 1-pyrroline-5-carboxylate dehydrogenase